MPRDGEEVYITPLETDILYAIAKQNPTVSDDKVVAILYVLAKKIKGAIKNEDIII